MNWRDYDAIWKRQPLPIGVDADIAVLRETFERTHRKMAATLQVRDISEALAGVIGSLAFGFIWWQQGAAGWPIVFAILLMLGVSGTFVRERISTRRQTIRGNAPMLDKVIQDLELLHHQRRMFLTMWRWYLAPIFVAIYIVVLTISCNRPAWDPLHSLSFQLGFLVFNGLIFWFIWLINRQAMRKQIEPRIQELEKLRRDLTGAAE